jgi:hypothetical protein
MLGQTKASQTELLLEVTCQQLQLWHVLLAPAAILSDLRAVYALLSC